MNWRRPTFFGLGCVTIEFVMSKPLEILTQTTSDRPTHSPPEQPTGASTSPSIRYRRWVIAAMFVAGLVVPLYGFCHAGSWLVAQDALERADVVVVLGGQAPFRAMEAARIYHAGFAEKIWLTPGFVSEEDRMLLQLAVHRPTEAEVSRQVLERLGVPAPAIRILPEPTVNTAAELKVIADEMNRTLSNRVIIVSSKYHGRRIRALWRNLADDRKRAIVRCAPDDPFDPQRWWATTSDVISVAREWFGLLNAWAGFPVNSQRGH